MKTLKFLALTLAIALFTTQIADAKGSDKLAPEAELRLEVSKLVKRVDVTSVANIDRKATLEFIITRDNKIVVLDIDTKSIVLEKAIKLILNYHRIDILGIKKMTAYRMDVSYNHTT